MRNKYCALTLLLLCIVIMRVDGAPRRTPVSTTFDQKQTGEYNIQLHLKDFQIIAVVGDDSFSSFGDYDYSYDYSDFTVKPSSHSTTVKPDTSTSVISSTDSHSTTTRKIPSHSNPYPIISPSTTTITPSTNQSASTLKSTTNATTPSPSTSPSTSTILLNSSLRPSNTLETTQNPISPIPGQIPVIVHQDFALRLHTDEKPLVKDVKKHHHHHHHETSVTIVPQHHDAVAGGGDEEDVDAAHPALGEILHYRKCAAGYQRDKRGRCRKVHRPQIPLGITRFATNLAARFRQANNASTDAVTTVEVNP